MAITGAVHAGDVVITPQQVVSNTLAYSRQLQILDRDSEAAAERARQARALGLPLVSVDARAARYDGLQDSAFGPGLMIPAIESRYAAGLQVSQPLYTGGRIDRQRESAQWQAASTRHLRLAAEGDVVLQALTAYWNWSTSFQLVESMRAAVDRMERHAKDIRNLHQAGMATENDALATDALLDRTRLRLDEAQRHVEVLGARLAFLTGQTLPVGSRPEPTAAQRSSPPLPPENALVGAAQTNRAERTARVFDLRAMAAQTEAARGEYAPQLSLVGRYEMGRPNGLDIPPRDEWQEDAFVGLTVSWNLLDWGLRKAKVAEAAARAAQAQSRAEQEDDRITLEVREALINLQDARQRIAVAERYEQSSRRNIKTVTDLWTNGLARHSEVLDAHAQLTDAQFEVIATRADAELAAAALRHATGQLAADLSAGTDRSTEP